MWHGLLAGIGFSVGLSIGVPLLFLFGLVVVVLYSKMFRRSDRVEEEEPSQNDD
jgi:predicted RND superfamily exporter protein